MHDEKKVKVIKGLECCSKGADREPTWNNLTARNCSKCPYNKPGIACTRALSYDALSALKEHEPRMMTLEEVLAHYSLPPVVLDDLDWQENYLQDIEPLYFDFPVEDSWVVHWRGYQEVRKCLKDWRASYGQNWRCWTSRPTQQQRGAVKWDE